MMKLISILLAIASSTTLTYHANVEGAGGLCMFVEFNESECSGLKDVLVGQGYSPGACPSTHARSNCDASAEEQAAQVWFLGQIAFGVECDFDFDHMSHGFTCPPSVTTYHANLKGTSGVCLFVDFDEAECSGLKDVLVGQGYSPGACPSTHARSNCDASAEEQVTEVWLLGQVAFGVECDLKFDHLSHGYACPPSGESKEMATYRFSEGFIDGACAVMEYDLKKCSKLTKIIDDARDWNPEPCPITHTGSCGTLTKRQENVMADMGIIFGNFCDDEDAGTTRYLCEDFSSIEFVHVYGDGTCETLGGYKTIMDGAKCEAAAIFLGKQDTTVNIQKKHVTADFWPAGCTYHQHQNLELWTESTGVCTTGQGCLCEVVEGSNPIGPRRKTFHKMHSASTCLSVEFDNTVCADLTNFLKNDQGYISGPCSGTHTKSQCESKDESEFEALTNLGIKSGDYCNLRSKHFTYSYACSKRVNKTQSWLDESSASSLSLLLLATVAIMLSV